MPVEKRQSDFKTMIHYGCLIAALSIFIISPFLTQQWAHIGESIGSIMRVIELDRGIKEGSIYPRWCGDFAGGFGMPYFVFYSPLVYYVSEFFHLLGLGIVDSLKCMIILGIFTGGIGMFVFTNSIWGKYGAFVSSISFIYAPYRMVNLYIRGDLAEAFAMSVCPFILYFFYRLILKKRFVDLAAASGFYAILIFTHNCTALIFSAFLLLVVGFVTLQNRDWKGLFLSLSAIIWAYALGAVFWFPALWEKKWVNIHLIYSDPALDFHNQFVSLCRLFSPIWSFEVGLGGVNHPFQIGAPHVLLTIFSFWFIMKSDFHKFRKERELWLFFLLLTILGIFLTNAASMVVWESIPLMKYLQFPYRFLTMITLTVSVLAGGLFCFFSKDSAAIKQLLQMVLAIIIVISGAQYCKVKGYYRIDEEWLKPEFVRMDGGTVSAYNREPMDRIIDYGEYLPKSVKRLPDKSSAGKVFVARGDAIINNLNIWMQKYTFEVIAAESSEIVVGSFFYPSWEGRLDDKKIPLFTNEEGLIHLVVPKGKSEIEIFFGESSVRKAAKYISLMSFLVMAIGSILQVFKIFIK